MDKMGIALLLQFKVRMTNQELLTVHELKKLPFFIIAIVEWQQSNVTAVYWAPMLASFCFFSFFFGPFFPLTNPYLITDIQWFDLQFTLTKNKQTNWNEKEGI